MISTWTEAYVINSKHFVEMMRGMSIGEDEMLVSFDAVHQCSCK